MPNPYFQFKRFTIYQDRCAMKVCTDACLFGAWVASFMHQRQPAAEQPRMLDIGCGTGLLSLMLAQKTGGTIDGLELDENASLQAKENIKSTEWRDRIRVINTDVRQYDFSYPYDLIISNPPFFENDLHSVRHATNMARHDISLTLETLVSIVSHQLSPSGSFAVLLPFQRSAYCIGIASTYNLSPSSIVQVKQSIGHEYFRSMILFERQPVAMLLKKEMAIKEGNNYTAAFSELLEDYYLYL